jgi:hypothetical protein
MINSGLATWNSEEPKVFKICISHNCIHMYLKVAGLAHEDPKKQKRLKWVRYERKHSLSAGHIDWHESGWSDLKVCVIIDDASRMILAGGEFMNINTENSKLVVDELVERYWWLCPMRELILDHGAEFGAHRIHEDGKWDSEFKRHLEKHGIKPILARVKHPQTNGKLERWFGEYKRHRLAFSSFEEFQEWYNNRPHGSLEFEHLEPQKGHSEERCARRCILLLATGCLDYERKYELFTRNGIEAGAKYFQDSTLVFSGSIEMLLGPLATALVKNDTLTPAATLLERVAGHLSARLS